VGEPGQHAVDHPRGQPAQEERVAPLQPAAAGDVGSGVDRRDQLGQVGRLVLQVAVHGDDDLAAGSGDACVHRGMLAEVAFEGDDADAVVPVVQAGQDVERPVGRAVVHEDHLGGQACAVDGLDDAVVERLDRPFLVEHGDDDAHAGRAHGRRAGCGGSLDLHRG
jgi:hypothetical protein